MIDSTNNNLDISVIIPVFNAAKALPELTERLETALQKMSVSYELIFVDDNSADNSWAVLEDTQKKYQHITVIRLAKNFGQHNATICGIKEAKGKTIITLDDDLEHPPEVIPNLYEQFLSEKRDLFYAIPKTRKKSFLRNTTSKTWNWVSKKSKKGTGNASSFRLIKRELTDYLLRHKEPFVFIESILFWYTENVGHQEIDFEKRKHGTSNYSYTKLFRLNHDLGIHYDTSALKLMMLGGRFFFCVSFILICYYLYLKFFGNPIQGYTSIIIMLLFATGSLMWGMGYLGLYISKMFRILNKEPQYKITEKIKN